MKFIYTKTFAIFAGILVVLLLALILQVKGWLQPIEYLFLQIPRPAVSAANAMFRPVATVFSTLTGMPKIVEENRQMQKQLGELRQQQVIWEQLKIENELLKNQLGFRNRSPYQLEPCTVLSMDPQNTSDAIILSCGQDSGIQVGQAVIANGYLLAKVVYVGTLNSTAVLITNSQSSVDAKLSKNDSEGVVKGSFGSGLVFDLVSQSADVSSGDLIVTAGIDSKIPKNILIGTVDQTLSGGNDLFKKTTVLSPLKANLVDYVFVIKP